MAAFPRMERTANGRSFRTDDANVLADMRRGTLQRTMTRLFALHNSATGTDDILWFAPPPKQPGSSRDRGADSDEGKDLSTGWTVCSDTGTHRGRCALRTGLWEIWGPERYLVVPPPPKRLLATPEAPAHGDAADDGHAADIAQVPSVAEQAAVGDVASLPYTGAVHEIRLMRASNITPDSFVVFYMRFNTDDNDWAYVSLRDFAPRSATTAEAETSVSPPSSASGVPLPEPALLDWNEFHAAAEQLWSEQFPSTWMKIIADRQKRQDEEQQRHRQEEEKRFAQRQVQLHEALQSLLRRLQRLLYENVLDTTSPNVADTRRLHDVIVPPWNPADGVQWVEAGWFHARLAALRQRLGSMVGPSS